MHKNRIANRLIAAFLAGAIALTALPSYAADATDGYTTAAVEETAAEDESVTETENAEAVSAETESSDAESGDAGSGREEADRSDDEESTEEVSRDEEKDAATDSAKPADDEKAREEKAPEKDTAVHGADIVVDTESDTAEDEPAVYEKKADNRADIKRQADNEEKKDPLIEIYVSRENDIYDEGELYVRVLRDHNKDEDGGKELSETAALAEEAMQDCEITPILPISAGIHKPLTEKEEKEDIRERDRRDYESGEETLVRLYMKEDVIDGLDGKYLLHQYDKEENLWEIISYDIYDAVEEDGLPYVEFTTNSFSPFIFADIEEKQEEPAESEEPADAEKPAETEEPAEEKPEAAAEADGKNDGALEDAAEQDAEAGKDIEEPAADETGNKDNVDGIKEEKKEESAAPFVTEDGKPLVEVPESEADGLLANAALSEATRRTMLKGTVLPPTQEPVTEDGMTIEKVLIKWLSRSTGSDEPAGYGTLKLAPITDDVQNQQWQVDFALSGKHEYEAGVIELVMPAYIWKDRNGEEPGILTLAVPEDPEKGADFSWRRVGDTIVFTNTHMLSAASKVFIQGTFRELTAHEMVDIDVVPESEYANCEVAGRSNDLWAQINITTPHGENISMASNRINAEIDTYVNAAAATKTAYNPTTKEYYCYWDVPSNIPADFIPENPEDYVFVRWYVSGQAKGNQPFTMSISDTKTDEYGAVLLGIQDANGTNIKSTDGDSASAVLYNGYSTSPKSAYVWTAYKKENFTEPFTIYTVHNTVTVTVKGVDDFVDDEETNVKRASASCSVAVPIEYTVVKEWDDDDNAAGLRPSYQYVEIYRNPHGNNIQTHWKSVKLVENPTEEQRAMGYGEWSYTWSDEGKAWHYETAERSFASGTFESWYDENSKLHTSGWSYRQKSKTYDPDERVWTFVNTLGYYGHVGDFAHMDKTVQYKYDDPRQDSTRDRALNELLHGNDAIVEYTVSGGAGTFEAYMDNVRAGSIDAHRVDLILEDYLDMVNNQRITIDDVDLAWVKIQKPSIYGYTAVIKNPDLPEDDPERYYDPMRYTLARYDNRYTDAVFEAYVNGQWITVAQLHNDTLTAENGASIDPANPLKIILPEDTEQFRERVSTFGAATSLSYNIGVRVHPTERILQEINNAAAITDYMMMTLDNFAKLYGEDNGENLGWELSDWDRGYLHGRQYKVAAWQKKTFRVTGNDTAKKRVKTHSVATVTQQSNVLTTNEYNYAAEQGDIPFTRAGVWYDLLPVGFEPDESSVRLQSGDRIKNVYSITDYNGTGRTLLVVEADLAKHVSYTNRGDGAYTSDGTYPKEGYKQTQKIEFDAYISWEDIRAYGLETQRNSIAFETDDDEIGTLNGWSGEPDDPMGGGNKNSEDELQTDAPFMKDLDKERSTPSFVYAGADLITDELDFAAETSIRKWVTADGSGLWSYGHNNEVTVYEGGKYTYRINMASDMMTTTKNIIILDSLENYVPTADKDDYGDAQWRGYLMSIDTAQLEEAGIAPVIYYSTVPGIDISKETGHYNNADAQGVIADILDNSGDWVKAEDYTGELKDVTAYAIDCRRTAEGSDFELNEGESLVFYVHMRAPAKTAAQDIWGAGKDAPVDPAELDITNPVHNAHAYNNIYLDSTQVDGQGRETHAYIHWDYVKVGIVPFNLSVKKEWNDEDDNDGIRPDGVTVHLYADGADTGIVLTLDDSNDWSGVIEHLLRYDYDTMEPDYDGRDDGHYIRYSFVEDAVDGYEPFLDRSGDNVTVINTHNPEMISIPFTKTWEGDEETPDARPTTIAVRLYADGEYTGTRKVISAAPDGTWSGVFENVYKYRNGHEVTYTVMEEYVDDYVVTYDQDAFAINNEYYPFGNIDIQKNVENGTEAALAQEFTFTLELNDAEGNELTERYDYKVFDGEGQEVLTGKIGHGGEFTLKGGQKAVVYDIPSHTEYKVTEAKKKGFTTSSEGDTGTVLSNKTAEVQFTNTYASKGKAEISAWKKLTGRELSKYLFKFDVYKVVDEEEILARSGANKEDGSVAFGAFSFTDADDGVEQVYKIYERNEEKPGYTYDDSVFTVRVTPHDLGNGSMAFDIVYEDAEGNVLTAKDEFVFPDGFTMAAEEWNALGAEEKEALTLQHQAPEFDAGQDTPEEPVENIENPATFSNSYHAEGSARLYAWKTLTGRKLTDGEFEFELLRTDEETGEPVVIQTKNNIADGSIVWDPIAYTEADDGKTYYYFVREKAGTDETVIYDASVFGYKVTVIDNGDGTLAFEQSHVAVGQVPRYPEIADSPDMNYVPGDDVDALPVFANKLKDGSLSVFKRTKYEGEQPHPEQEFHFKVEFIDPEGRPMEDGTMEYSLEQVENDGTVPAEAPGNGDTGSGSGTDGTGENAGTDDTGSGASQDGDNPGGSTPDENSGSGSSGSESSSEGSGSQPPAGGGK